MTLIDGRAIAADIAAELTATITAADFPARLAVVVPTDDPATGWYVRSIVRAAGKVGVECDVHTLTDPSTDDIATALTDLSADPTVHGIICQTPLPDGVKLEDITSFIAPAKDVDGANPATLGRLAAGLPTFAPATAAAVMEILRRSEIDLRGTRAVVVGRSRIVGKPAALLLLDQDATVTVCHSRTKDLVGACAQADVLVAAVGRPGLITGDHVKPGAIVIDVGTNTLADGTMTGDVDQESVAAKAGMLTPVPGGVGPVTTMMLLKHTVEAAYRA